MTLSRRVAARLACASLLSLAAGCGSSAAEIGSSTGAIGSTWTSVGYGIHGTTVGSGASALVVYGGYTATDADSEALSLAYVSALLGGMGVGHVYASRGPEDASYAAREIGNSALAAELASLAGQADFIVVAAHSSGAFVADELFTEANAEVLSKIVYFDLDGGSWALTNALVGSMKGVYFCDARDPAVGDSHNFSAIVSLHSDFPASHYFTVDASGSGCDEGATWCLHDTLITTRPHNLTTFDLDDDYTDFTGSGRHVVLSEMQQAVSDGVLPAGGPPMGSDAGADAGSAGDASASGGCTLGGQAYAENTCTETLQCDSGAWVARTMDPSACRSGVQTDGACLTDSGEVVPENTCTSTLQCDDGAWMERTADPASCL
jgi:hypothetical protein